MFKNTPNALKYLVKVDYTKTDSNGSGVLVPINNEDYAYILTAKHTFGLNNDETSSNGYNKIIIENIDKNFIELTHPKPHKFIIKKVVNLNLDAKIDLVIFQIEKDDYIRTLPPLDIYEDSFQMALAYGYPTMKKEDIAPYQPILGTYTKIGLENKFELHLKDFPNLEANQDTHEYVVGLSGAGVFVEDNREEEIYLAGIVTDSGTGNNIKCINIIKLSQEINRKLKEQGLTEIFVSGAKWKDELGFDITDLNFEEIISDLSSKYKHNEFIKKLSPLEDNRVEFIKIFDERVSSKLHKSIVKLSELSQIYLYIAMKFHNFNENIRATAYFNKAIEYGGNKNKSYLLSAKAKREENKNYEERTNQEKELILKSIQNLYNEMYEYEEELKNNPNDESIKILLKKCYQDLVEKLSFFEDRKYEINEITSKFMKLDFNQNDNMQEQIFELRDMIKMSQQFEGMKNQVNAYKEEIKKLNKQIQILPKMDKKLDVITLAIKKTNNKTLDNFLSNIVASNRALVSKIQTINHQDNRIHKKAKERLDESIKTLNSKLDDLMERPISISSNGKIEDISQFKQIVEESNWKFYKAIKGLCENETDSYNRKLFEMSLAFTKREHDLYIEKLEKIHFDEVRKIKRESSLEKDKLEESLSSLTTDFEKINKNLKESLSSNSKEKILELKRIIQGLEGKNEQINELKESIKLSSDTANILGKLSENNRGKLDNYILKIDDKYQELDNETKRIFSKEFNEVLGNIYSSIDALSFEPNDNKESFEKIFLDLEELDTKLESFEDNIEEKVDEVHKKVDIYPIKVDPEINLHLKKSDLKKIESIISKDRWNSFDKIYTKIQFVVFGIFIMVILLEILK